MPQQKYEGFTPDPEPDLSGFTPDEPESGSTFDPETASDLERQVLGLPPKSDYTSFWDTAASYIPQPVKSAWKSTWEPIETIAAPIRGAARSVAEPMMQYGESGSGLLNTAALYGGAFTQSVGDVVAGLTSPGNLALTAATGGAGAARGAIASKALPVVAPKVAQGLTTAGRAIGGATAAHGVQTIADPRTTMLEKGMGAIEAVGGGLATRAPKPRAAAPAPIPDELPIPPRAAPIEPPAGGYTPTPGFVDNANSQRLQVLTDKATNGTLTADELVEAQKLNKIVRQEQYAQQDPNLNQGVGDPELAGSTPYQAAPEGTPAHVVEPAPGSFGAEAWDEIQQKMANGTATEDDIIDMMVIQRVNQSGKVAPAPKPAGPTAAQQFEASVLGEVKPPNVDANLSRLTPGGLDEMNKLYDQPTPAMTPELAAEGMAKPPTTNVQEFLQSVKSGEAPAKPAEVFDPNTLEFVDPKTGELKPAATARPGDVPVVPPRRAGGRMGAPELGPPIAAPKSPMERLQALTPDQQQGVNNLMAEGMSADDALAAMESGQKAVSVTPEPVPAVVGKSAPTEVKGQVGGQVPQAVANDAQRLPKALQGAKPRFNIGADSYFPNFADDLDKALYIIGQKVKSKADDQYLKFVMEQTGLSEVAARNAGAQVKAAIKEAARNSAETGKVDIPPIMRERLAQQGGGGGKPPVKPPVTTGGTPEPPQGPKQTPKEFLEGKPQISTGPIKPENVKPVAEEVTTSLANRLKKAVDEAGTPNAVAADDIRALMDEAAEVLNSMPDGPAKQGLVRQILGANKAILTSWDLSAPGRQGKAFIFNKAYWTSWDDMFKAWGSQKGADLVNQSIVDHPSGYFTKPVSESGKAGKSFAEKVGLDLAATEENFTGVIDRAAGKIPLVGRSSRAHTAFLNKLRSDQFVAFMDQAKAAGKNPETNLELAKSYAKFINDATGRGSVNIGQWKLERNLGVLNDVFFAPKNMSGQIRTWNGVLNPVKYYNYDPVLRKQALKSLMAIGGMGMGVSAAASMAGAKVGYDPFSSDFQKIKVGDTRIDLFGGYQQFPVAAMKFIAGLNTPTTGQNEGRTQDLTAGRFGQSRETVAERFFTNRLSPLGSFVYSWMSGREFDGKPFEVKKALYERVFPIAAKDIGELMMEDPALAVLLAPLSVSGFASTQVYGR